MSLPRAKPAYTLYLTVRTTGDEQQTVLDLPAEQALNALALIQSDGNLAPEAAVDEFLRQVKRSLAGRG